MPAYHAPLRDMRFVLNETEATIYLNRPTSRPPSQY
ncbi:acyl-CoA dehydrogenase N-terminal domain-containing protein [Pseudomonas sp. NPDC089401]